MLLKTPFFCCFCSNYVLKFRISALQYKDMQRLLTEIRFVTLHWLSFLFYDLNRGGGFSGFWGFFLEYDILWLK